jgi:hypothetical protein
MFIYSIIVLHLTLLQQYHLFLVIFHREDDENEEEDFLPIALAYVMQKWFFCLQKPWLFTSSILHGNAKYFFHNVDNLSLEYIMCLDHLTFESLYQKFNILAIKQRRSSKNERLFDEAKNFWTSNFRYYTILACI